MGAFNDLTEEAIRGLAELRAPDQTVISIYFDLDPAQFATAGARATEIDSLIDAAHREIEGRERPHEELLGLRKGLARARELLPSRGSLAQGAHALALFVCKPLGLERALRLPQPVASAVVISHEPFIAPLQEQGRRGRVCVALIDERFARILRGSGERLRELVSFGDEVHGRHDQGGWSQARYQRSIENDVDAHLAHVGRVLHDLLKISPYELLLIACTEPLWARVLDRLHADVRARLRAERVSLDLSDASIADVERAAAPMIEAEQREREEALLKQLRERDGREQDGRAATGLQPVLEALVERRVRALLYEAGFQAPGVECEHCGWLGTEGDRCPFDGSRLRARENVIEPALHLASRQSAEILPLRDRPELGPLGRIAATLHF
jgi:peptide chain release factor subunit 1